MNLTPLSGFGLCLSIAGAFVGRYEPGCAFFYSDYFPVHDSLYLLPRRIKQLPRDDPKHIKARLLVYGILMFFRLDLHPSSLSLLSIGRAPSRL